MSSVKIVRRRKEGTGAVQEAGCRVATAPALSPSLPTQPRATWRVFEPGNGLSSFDLVHIETAVQREALTAYRDLRHRGYPVIVACWQIYRVLIGAKKPPSTDRFAFVEAYSEDDACARVAAALVSFDRCPYRDVRLRVSAKSYEDCRIDGVSADLELRLFEVGWTNGCVTEWVREPMFLLPEPSVLTRKWSQVPEGLPQ